MLLHTDCGSVKRSHPGSWKPASQRFSISLGQTMERPAQHPYLTTGNRSLWQRGKRDPTHKRFIIWTCQQKTAVQGKHGKVHQIWMCYTNPFTSIEIWAGFEVSHSYPFGPIWLCHCSQMVWRRMRSCGCGRVGGGLSFLLTELFLSARAREKGTGQCTGPWPLESTLSSLCVSQFSVSTAAGSLLSGAASCCPPPTWSP